MTKGERQAVNLQRTGMHPLWQSALQGFFAGPTGERLRNFLRAERSLGQTVYPPSSQIFRALAYCPPAAIKAVILGQDPYHGPGQAEGLCFSVPEGVSPPPSLQNIFRELQSDLGISPAFGGSLEPWARQGVLLLNTVLTVRAGKPGSHRGQGWEEFTDAVLTVLKAYPGKAYLLWGAAAKARASSLLQTGNLFLGAAHPSPLSANHGFFGCRHFSKCNKYLLKKGVLPVNWDLQKGRVQAS